MIEFGDFQLDAVKHVLRRDGEVVQLALKAVELLSVLVENPGEVVTKEELMSRVWPNAFVEDSVLTQNIYILRKTLGYKGSKDLIKTVPRRGYYFNGKIRAAETNGSASVIERHLVERISLDVEEEKSSVKTNARFLVPTLVFAAIVVLSIAAAGIYFYRVDPSQKTALNVPPQLKLKPPSAASGFKSLAVLPFTGSDAQFARSISDGLSIRLGNVNKFDVKAPAVLAEYIANGAELKTDFALQGKVEPEKGVYAATITFTDTKSSKVLWSDSFEFDNLIQLQDAVANRTVKELLATLTAAEIELIAKRLPSNLSAYENFQTGRLLWRKRLDGSAYLKRAIELDQSFAPAYAMLANMRATAGVKDSPEAREAQELLEKALALDENLPDAYAVQGFMRIFHHRDWPDAERSLKSALELDPNNINARHWLGVFYSIHRRLDEAKAEMGLALDLDPTNPTLLADIGQLHYFAGEKETAIEFCKKALTMDPSHSFANGYLSMITSRPSIENEEAVLNSLEKTVDENSFGLPYINVDPRYDAIRYTERFRKVLRKMNL